MTGHAGKAATRWRLGEFVFDAQAMRLEAAGRSTPIDRSGCDLLLCLLRNQGRIVAKEELLRTGWPGRVVTENSLTKSIGRLRAALDDPDGRVLQVVHGYGYRLVADAQPVAEEIADAAPAPEPAPASGPPPRRQRVRRWWTPIAAGLVGMFALVGLIHTGWQSSPPAVAVSPATPNPTAATSIAVLPFLDLSENHDQAYFSDGLAEELLDSLARLPQLRVVGRTSSFAFRGQDLDIPTIGRKLDARVVLEGSVRKSADRIRVTAQLVSSVDGYRVWSQTYDRPITELFAMQDEIARAIVSALRIELLPGQARELVRHETTSAAAYDEYLLAMRVYKDDETANRRSLAHLGRAVEIDPDFDEAWISLAGLLGHNGLYADTSADALAGKRRALEIVDRVIARHPARADAFRLRGVLRCAHWWDWNGAQQDFEQTMRLSPPDDEQPLVETGRLLAALGRLPEAIALELRATQVNPESGNAWTVLGYHYTALAQYDRARDVLTQSLRIDPLDEHAHYYLGLGELLQGRSAEAIPYFEDSAHVLRLTGLALAHHSLGKATESEQDLQLLIARYGHILPYQAAEIYAWRGEKDKAFEWLERSWQLHEASFIYYAFDPLLRNLRDDPRYDALRVRLNLPPPATHGAGGVRAGG